MTTDTISKEQAINGWINGFIGVLLFSGSMPATKLAVMEMNPVFVTIARAVIAGILALSVLLLYKEKRPEKTQIFSLILVAIGCVIGFPLLSSLALQHLSSAHSIVFLGMLPLSTAVFGVLRGGERPHPVFWFFSVVGSLLVMGYAFSKGISASPVGDLLMLLAVILCGLGYAEGAKLSKSLGGWQVISLFSMFIGFIFWYKGLAQGGISSVGQLQLLQPFFGLALAAYFLHEQVSAGMVGVTVGVIVCVAGTKKFAK